MRREPRNWLPLCLVAVLCLHVAMKDLIVSNLSTFVFQSKKKEKEIVVEKWDEEKERIVENKGEKKEGTVRTLRNLEESKALNEKKARFGGEFKNRVEKERQAALRGEYFEGRPLPILPDGEEEQRHLTLSDLMGLSRSPYELPDDIEVGNQTLLNTDPVLYASFGNRVTDEIYAPWVSELYDTMERIERLGRTLSPNVYVTKLMVVFDESGEVLSIKTVRSCGVKDIDLAAKQAFWETEPFPNPPFENAVEDGVFRFVYEFIFDYKDSGFSIFNWNV